MTSEVQKSQEIGGLAGRLVFAILAVWFVSRRNLFRLFQIPAMLFVPLFYWWMSGTLGTPGTLTLIRGGMFLVGFLVISQMSFWGNYIPLVFPVHLRGTGESFSANIGGRILGTMAAWISLTLAATGPGKADPSRLPLVCAGVAAAYALVGFLLTFFLPEPRPDASVLDD